MVKSPQSGKRIDALKHEAATRRNIPTAEMESFFRRDEDQAPLPPQHYPRTRSLAESETRTGTASGKPELIWNGARITITEAQQAELAATGTLTLSDAQLVWRGKDKQDWSALVVNVPPLYIQEKIHPKAIIDDLKKYASSLSSPISREPEQVKAFRDTWKDGIHSYLTYLRDCLTVMRDLLTESGSIFVQIGDENVHRVRAVMDEVFGAENIISQIQVKKAGYSSSDYLSNVFDIVLWYGKTKNIKYRALYGYRSLQECDPAFCDTIQLPGGVRRQLTPAEKQDLTTIPISACLLARNPLVSPGPSLTSSGLIEFHWKKYPCPNGAHWKTTPERMERLLKADRLIPKGNVLRMVRFLEDNQLIPLSNLWTDTGVGGFVGDDKIYVVQSDARLVERCLLMATDDRL